MAQKVNPTSIRVGRLQECNYYWFAHTNAGSGCKYSETLLQSLFESTRTRNAFAHTEVNTAHTNVLRSFWQQAWCAQNVSAHNVSTQSVTRGGRQTQVAVRESVLKTHSTHEKANALAMMMIVNHTYGTALPPEYPKENRKHTVYIHTCLSNASAISTYIVQGLEERKPLKQIYKSISRECNPKYNAKIKGIRVSCSGRLEGGEIASTHTYKDGETSVHRLRNTIDYAYKDANTVYGVIGVKVWLTYA
jgi:hypothetical protein